MKGFDSFCVDALFTQNLTPRVRLIEWPHDLPNAVHTLIKGPPWPGLKKMLIYISTLPVFWLS